MSHIDELIGQLCPDGVEFKPGSETLFGFATVAITSIFGKGDVPVYGSGGVMTRVDTVVPRRSLRVLIPTEGR